MNIFLRKYNNGQVMLLSVILITTAVLGMATLVGSLMIYEIRYSYDVVGSAKALYAADAGVECVAYKEYVNSAQPCGGPGSEITLGNGAQYRVEYVPGVSGISVGTFGPPTRRTARSFEIGF